MKQTWIHFIGKSYYTIPAFIKEAKNINVSRAVSPQVFRKMNLGDLVLLAQKDGPHTKIFGCFIIKELTGLTPKVINRLVMSGEIRKTTALTPMLIKRECGQYEVTNHYVIYSNEQFMSAIKNLTNEEIGRVMVGGSFYPLGRIGMETDHILTDLPFRKGYRLFDIDSLMTQYKSKVQTVRTGRHVKVRGQFYVAKEDSVDLLPYTPPNEAILLQIQNYQLN